MQPKYWYCHSVSQRSNSFHSQSLNTCSSIISTNHYHHHQQQQQPSNQLRYKEIDLMKLKRPLIVSFRKIPYDTQFSHTSSFESGSAASQMTDFEQRERTHMIDSLRFSVNETLNPIYSCFNEKDGGSMVTTNSPDYNTHKSNHKIITWLDHYSKFNRRERVNGENLSRLGLYNSTSSVPVSNGYLSATCRKSNFHPSHKKLYNSPYNSPEMTYNSKKLEENLNIILKQLVFKNETFNCQIKTNGKHSGKQFHRNNNIESISKSKSVPCFSTLHS